MDTHTFPVVASLIGIVITGSFGILLITEIGVPVILVYISYLALTAFALMIPISLRRIRWGFMVNVLLAVLVMVANTITVAHMNIILTMEPVYNAIILISGAYVLQPILLITSLRAFQSLGKGG